VLEPRAGVPEGPWSAHDSETEPVRILISVAVYRGRSIKRSVHAVSGSSHGCPKPPNWAAESNWAAKANGAA